MPPKAEKTAEKTAVQQVKEQIESVAKRMRRDQPVHIQLSNGNSVELKSSLLDTITSGRRFSREAWNDVIDILIRPRFPDVLIDNSDDKFPPLKDKQQCFRLGWSRNSLDYPSISNLIFAIQHSVPKVEIYTVREGFNFKSLHGIKAQIIGEVVGVEWHKLVYTYHQELPLRDAGHYPFQDAILFDMLLDLIIGEYEPHTRDIADAPSLQLQLLLALEREQLKAEAALSIGSNKRKLTIEERLKGKRMKKE